jgi:hypothetical protein
MNTFPRSPKDGGYFVPNLPEDLLPDGTGTLVRAAWPPSFFLSDSPV